MFGKKAQMLLLTILGWQTIAWSQALIDKKTTAYFTIQDTARLHQQIWQTPTDLIQEGFATVAGKTSTFSLLNWIRHAGAPPVSPDPYNRKKHFGTWINDPTDSDCFNTRAKILIRDSLDPVTMKENNHCIVDGGRWEDPYSGVVHTSARDVQIDHVVPLKNAFVSGAWTWTTQKRCLYGNFTANNFHLIAVDGHENMAKGDNAPDQYMPSRRSYVCQYLQEWLKIKMIWKLEMTESEAQAIMDDVKQFGCSQKQLSISDSDLLKQRVASDEVVTSCEKMAVRIEQRMQEEAKQSAVKASYPMAETQ